MCNILKGCIGKICYLMLFLFYYIAPAQRLIIDSNAYGKWPTVGRASISNDGEYVFYTIYNNADRTKKLCVQSTDSNWKREFPGGEFGQLTQNGRKLIFKQGDKVSIVELGTDSIEQLDDILNLKIIARRNSDALVYKNKGATDDLVFRDLASGNETKYSQVGNSWFSPDEHTFFLEYRENGGMETQIVKMDFFNHEKQIIWKGRKCIKLVFSNDSSRLAFVADDSVNNKSLWYYSFAKERAEKLLDERSEGIEVGLKIKDIEAFNRKNDRVFFELDKIDSGNTKDKKIGVDIWSYKDDKLQSQQLLDLSEKIQHHSYKAVVNISDHQIIKIEDNDQSVNHFFYPEKSADYVLVVVKGRGDLHSEWNWNRNALTSIYLESLKDGSKRLIKRNIPILSTIMTVLSGDEKYVLYYDPEKKAYFSYNISSGLWRNLTSAINAKWCIVDKADEPTPNYNPIGVAGIFKDGCEAIIYSQKDIFQIDLSGKLPPVNLTNGYGAQHDVEFRLALPERYSLFESDEEIILHSFDRIKKNEGFCAVTIGKKLGSVTPALDAYKYDFLVKATGRRAYAMVKMSASESPNLFFTKDFITFNSITDIHPERKYNWLTTELVEWKTLDGSMSQGVIYKPTDFDARKKYPVIMYYYERLSDNLNEFDYPNHSGGTLNLPLFVSNGYLVFVPDIHYKIGFPGHSAYNSVISAVLFLKKKSYIDASKIGLQGMSFGGFETNYIISHTNMFAAAMSASGMSDFISIYGSTIGDGTSRQRQYELYRDRMGATLWKVPQLYIENSPVLRADKIKTPLLIMANKEDKDVPYQQGVELFTALRRLGKKAWMLQYDGEGHGIGGKAADDLDIRMFQFFNYYLKNKLPPLWMTVGVPARLKGQESGLELDSSGRKP